MFVKILKYIRFILYELKIIKLYLLTDKIEYLLVKNISIYDNDNISNALGKFISKDIISFIAELSEHNNFDIYNKRAIVKPISSDRLHIKTYLKWCTENDRLLSNENVIIHTFLKESLVFIIRYNDISKNLENNIGYSNSIKLKPYIINIEMIINTLGGIEM